MVTGLVLLLILLSFALVIGVPVTFAKPDEWEQSKGGIFNLALAWSVLVIITGLLASAQN